MLFVEECYSQFYGTIFGITKSTISISILSATFQSNLDLLQAKLKNHKIASPACVKGKALQQQCSEFYYPEVLSQFLPFGVIIPNFFYSHHFEIVQGMILQIEVGWHRLLQLMFVRWSFVLMRKAFSVSPT